MGWWGVDPNPNNTDKYLKNGKKKKKIIIEI